MTGPDYTARTEEDNDQTEDDASIDPVGRRTFTKVAGVAVASGLGLRTGSGAVQASSDGYGNGDYGDGPYGDPDGLGVGTDSATNVGTTSATVNGSLDDLGGAESVDCYVEWRPTGTDSWNTTAAQTLSSTGSFSDDISGLEHGREYEYRAVGEASDGDVDQGSTVTFTTTDDPPAVTTDQASSVTDSSVTLNGSLDDLGGASSSECYFQWREAGTSTWSATSAQTLSETGPYGEDVSGLSGGTEYEYRSVADASDNDSDTGGTVSFTTDSSSSAPAIASYDVTEANSPNPHLEVTADWSVSDADGDLDTVVVGVIDSTGSVVDSITSAVSGSTASGTGEFKIKHVDDETFDVTLTVTDAAGNSTSQTEIVTE